MTENNVDNQEVVRRIRAARAYAGVDQKALGEAIQTSGETIKRMESGKRIPKKSELWAIAEACDLPRTFFVIDFKRLDAGEALFEAAELVNEHPDKLALLSSHFGEIARRMRETAEQLEADLEDAVQRAESTGQHNGGSKPE